MKTTTIILPATVSVVDEERSTPIERNAAGHVIGGSVVTREIPAGEEVTLPEAEALALVERYGGRVKDGPEGVKRDPASTDLDKVATLDAEPQAEDTKARRRKAGDEA